MGLDTTHNCWQGSYSAFSRWRDQLGEIAGYTFHKNKWGQQLVDIDWGNVESIIGLDLNGIWPFVPIRPDGTPDALMILLAHSDCEGYIQSNMCEPLANRLEELLPELEKLEDDRGHIGNWSDKTKQFIKGLRLASKGGERVGFH